ncbi:hypothetical protein Pint_06233 [Pistacia integerrima]|uniref:Uncharacterized protein n=1 Tax=Pistacia integerrima TaxID=434235 RepID=A0ACC0Z964_9ROSI|nr:hypothetical protein Pint_06233 [Pistacia integerrima]
MVLSNKKLKQKLRAAIAENLTSSTAIPDSNGSNNESTGHDLDPNSKPHSLKQLLDSVTQKPRLSKREKKRRKTLDYLPGTESVNSENGCGKNENDKRVDEESNKFEEENKEDSVDKKKKKKRKRNDEERKKLDDGEEESGVVKQAKKLKKNKKKKKQKKAKAKVKNEEENKGSDGLVGNEEPNKENDSQVNDDVATKVYVGGIPYNASEHDIRTYFEGCGSITEIDYMTFPDTGKFRGIAIISFRTEGAAKRALALDGSEMDGLFLKIQPYKTTRVTRANKAPDFAPKIMEGYNRIYVGNLSWDITEDDLRKFLSDCKISSIRFGMDKETGEFRGYAHVDFDDSLSLSMALMLDQEIVCGRPVKISCAVPPKKGVNTLSSSVPTSNVTTSEITDNRASNVVTSNITDNTASNVATSNGTDNAGADIVSGKIRRRTCYECGEKGHLSSACPNKTADPTNSITS